MEEALTFKYIAQVKGMHLQPHRPDGLKFDAPDGLAQFTLVPKNPIEDGSGLFGLVCTVTCVYETNSSQIEFVKDYIGRRLCRRPEGGMPTLPHLCKNTGQELISAHGEFAEGYRPSLHLCPQDIQELVLRADREMSALAQRFLRLVRWRQDADGPNQVIESGALYWSAESGKFYADPPRRQEHSGPTMFGIRWDPNNETETSELWLSGCYEPIGHELLREARQARLASPRSALIMVVTALEAGIKSHVSRVAPDAAWLMDKAQTPPIFDMLNNYIPLLHMSRGVDIEFWDKIKPKIKKIQKLVEFRNTVTHTGNIPKGAEEFDIYFDIVRDILYLLDVLDGHEWAKQRVSRELRKNLGWPSPSVERLWFSISTGAD